MPAFKNAFPNMQHFHCVNHRHERSSKNASAAMSKLHASAAFARFQQRADQILSKMTPAALECIIEAPKSEQFMSHAAGALAHSAQSAAEPMNHARREVRALRLTALS